MDEALTKTDVDSKDETIEPGDIIRYADNPYDPIDDGVYTHGIVAEKLGEDHISVYPYNPRSGTLLLQDRGSRPVFVDENIAYTDVVLVQKATESYKLRDQLELADREEFINSLPRDTDRMFEQAEDSLEVMEEHGQIESFSTVRGVQEFVSVVADQGSDGQEMACDLLRKFGFVETDVKGMDWKTVKFFKPTDNVEEQV